ncbi:MAG TPA: DoxX family protein, partial [Chitinophagaceae bacterium]|nr:DoxX family protein [Chitinophagaceae bacterium]
LSFYLVAFAEGICALLIILGLYTRLAALVLAFNFIVILIVHSADNFIDIEHIYLYLFSYLTLIFTGSGKLGLDNYLFNRK